jgi:hypothetical protein
MKLLRTKILCLCILVVARAESPLRRYDETIAAPDEQVKNQEQPHPKTINIATGNNRPLEQPASSHSKTDDSMRLKNFRITCHDWNGEVVMSPQPVVSKASPYLFSLQVFHVDDLSKPLWTGES